MIAELLLAPPGTPLMLGALLVPLFRGRARQALWVVLPLASFVHMLAMPLGTYVEWPFFDYVLAPVRVDALSRVWGLIYHIAALLTGLFALHVRDRVEQSAAFVYAGSAIAAVFAGDLLTLFVFWELTALSSAFLVWASRTERSYRSGMRYMVVQITSGLLLLAGTILHLRDTGSLEFGRLGLDSTGSLLIFLAFGIKCAFPLLHNWLTDAYPEATPTGAVFLSAYTTKLAVYALARGFPGTEILIPIGALMTAFPIFYAVIENDLRRVLAYSLNNQLGFMVVGIGIGTELSINGTAAHAFCHILYKALLFMAMGAVLFRTGTCKGSELGGLRKSMPWTTLFCMVGAASISAFPLFSGFVSKALILNEAAAGHHVWTYFVLIFASAGVFHHSGIKIPYFAFFGHDSGKRCAEAPRHMLLAMGATAFLCVAIGCFPGPLYRILPYPVDFAPYDLSHVVMQLQLLLFSALAFGFLQLTGLYPPELRSTNLDSDWVYRRLVPRSVAILLRTLATTRLRTSAILAPAVRGWADAALAPFTPAGFFARSWTSGATVLWVATLLGLTLLLYFRR